MMTDQCKDLIMYTRVYTAMVDIPQIHRSNAHKEYLDELDSRINCLESEIEHLQKFYGNESQLDLLFAEAAKLVCADHDNARPTRLQLHLKLGYNRANRIIKQLVDTGILDIKEERHINHPVLITVSELPYLLKILLKNEN